MPPDDQTAHVEPEVTDDIRSLLSNAFDEQESTSEPVTEGRLRGLDGKFVKTDASDSPVVDAPEPPESVEDASRTPIKPEADKPVAEAKPIEPPSLWSDSHKETFRKIPVEAQEFVMGRYKDMEADYTRKTMEIAAFKRDYDPVREILAPYDQQMRAAGFTPASLIKGWADVEVALTRNPLPIVKDIIQKYNIDPVQLGRALGLTGAGGTGGAGTEQPAAPDAQTPIQLPPEVMATLQQLQQQQGQFSQFLSAQQQRQQTEAINRVMSTIETFKGAKDGSGNLLHPHYDDLESDMIRDLEGARKLGQEPTLDELYERAVWANTSTREKILNGQRAADEAQRKAAQEKERGEARAKAERARRAGSSVTGTPGTGQAAIAAARAEGGSLRDQLAAAFDDVSDRPN